MEMSVIALGTGAAGFLASSTLLHLGLYAMWLRYLIALAVAYLVFFALLRLWLLLRGRRIEARDVSDLTDVVLELRLPRPNGLAGGGGQFGGGGASALIDGKRALPAAVVEAKSGAASSLDLFDPDEAVLPLLLIAALLAALLAAVWIVYSAPSLFAELLVDGALVGGLYRRLRRNESRSWISTILRNTALPFAATGLLFVAAGWFIQSRIPEARSIGDAVRQMRSNVSDLPSDNPLQRTAGLRPSAAELQILWATAT